MTLFITFFTAFLLGVYTTPMVIRISKIKGVYDEPDERKLQKTVVPTLGGISIFISFMIASLVGLHGADFNTFSYILGGLTIIFFTGMKDDLINISPSKKTLLQIAASLLVIVLANVRITHLNGLLGIGELNYISSVFITVFIFVFVMNALNLIDGIDGLASSVAIISSVALSIFFYRSGQMNYFVMTVALVGSYTAFFFYNVFGIKNKIFMGDTGSLVLGFLTTVFIIQFVEMSTSGIHAIGELNAIALAVAILIVPIFDTTRVFMVRLANKRSPFSPDRNHLHHLMLKLVNNKHIHATAIIATYNIFAIVVSYFALSNLDLHFGIGFVIMLGAIMVSIPVFLVKLKEATPAEKPANSADTVIWKVKVNSMKIKERRISQRQQNYSKAN